ncbi:hypothetical protein CAPTEDRAFT_196737 [Capitella teleta]|uniref:BHLH domain-containing protein n=1 Tax=Capitella teleta TaxID=283909 RepID=R7U8V5_CAPTE|nr:hypothetical protein CAPTEDRAFT_196737 [Capitella teleta]|eukprot:ELU02556.1 hypothetical protein CAPTEDRAFT_196737 [Capitella teleta]
MGSELQMSPCKQYSWPMLNFAASPGSLEFGDFPQRKNRTPRDPMSHRIIEKRRRDRMNNCLADLSHLIPATYLKQQGQGRIEKTEIIEMGIKHIHTLQSQVKSLEQQISQTDNGSPCSRKTSESTIELGGDQHSNFKLGFQECRDEAMKFLVERQELNAADPLCRNLMHHLQEQLNKYQPSQRQTQPTDEQKATDNSQASNPSSEFTQENNRNNTLANQVKTQQKLMSASRDLDEHLRGLLGESRKRSLWSSDASMMSDTTDSMQNSIPMNMDRDGLMSVEQSGTETSSSEERRQDNFRNPSNYKFKNDIKLRFSADMLIGGKETRGRTGSMISQDDQDCKMKEGTTSLSSSDTTSYPGSDFSSNGNGSSRNSSNGNLISSCASSDSSSLNGGQTNSQSNPNVEVPALDLANSVPGFALHPAGAYYIPVVTPVSQLMPFIQNYSPSGICHPISIPVNLGGPYICMHNLHPGQASQVKLENSSSSNNNQLLLQAKAC